jgi:outer membrane protein assembly factor BamB
MTTRFKSILSSTLGCLVSIAFYGQDWQVGSGGTSARHCLTEASGPEEATILWEGGPSSVVAQQAVIDNGIVATARMFDLVDALNGTVIVAQELETGDTLWTTQLPIDFADTDWRSRVSAFKDGVIYATRSGNTNASYMYALSAADGSILWQSEDLVDESSTEGAAFASNGDLIVGNFQSVIRIDYTDGTTVWETAKSTPTSNGQEVAVFGERAYYWEANFGGPVVSVIDVETGDYLYSSESLSAGLAQQLPLFAGPDGIIYAPRSQNNADTDFLFALEDTGSEFTELWQVPLPYIPFSTSGVGPDGSVYSYSSSGRVIRIDPADGNVLDSSQVIFAPNTTHHPRMAIDANGYVHLTNGEFATGAFFSFNPDLTLRWTETITNVNVGGPAVADDGTLVICGVGGDVRAYQGTTPITNIRPNLLGDFLCWPNPATTQVKLDLSSFANHNDLTLAVKLVNGQVVDQININSSEMDSHYQLDVSKYAAGYYALVLHRDGYIKASSRLTIVAK